MWFCANCFDIEATPAIELAALYHRRCTIEQEFYALLLAHATIRRLMAQAASRIDQTSGELAC